MNTTSSTKEYALSKGYRNYVFILLFLLYLFDYTDRMVVTSLFPFIKQDWGLSDAQCGLLVSAIYWSILIFTFPVSIMVDRWSRRKTIAIMAILWSVATGVCAFTKNFTQLFSARSAIGVGEAGYAPGGTAMISGLYPQEKRAQIMGIWNASIPIGSALGIALGGIVATHWGWRHAFGLVAIPGLIVGILFFFVKDYKTISLTKTVISDEKGETKRKMKFMDIVKEFAGTPSLILTNLAFPCVTFVTVSLMTWLTTFFHRIENVPEAKAGVMAGAVMMLALVGAPLGGYLSDLWLKKRPNARPLFAALSTLISAILLFIGLTFFEGTARYVIILFVGLFVVAFLPAAAAITQDVVHAGLRATSYALCVVIQHLLGSSLGPIVIGSMSDSYGIQAAMNILPISLVLGAILFFAASFFYVKDLNKVEKVHLEME
ncbi:MAG: MFS transporter [Spirochaetes bacterium]|nr:MFS transporter [Spirochaetota bacterium]